VTGTQTYPLERFLYFCMTERRPVSSNGTGIHAKELNHPYLPDSSSVMQRRSEGT
jgi:hypothetical protein